MRCAPIRIALLLAVASSVTAIPSIASAQAPAGQTEGQGASASSEDVPRVQAIKSVERGVFLETDIGVGFFINKMKDRAYGLALGTGVFLGFDVLPILSLSVGAMAMAAPITRGPDVPLPQGDLLFLMPMAQVQFALITTERNFLYVRGGAGFGFGLPATLGDANNDGVEEDYGGNGPVFMGTVGFERYTKLRHFSLGIQAGVLGVTKPDFGLGIIVTPTLKYTF